MRQLALVDTLNVMSATVFETNAGSSGAVAVSLAVAISFIGALAMML